MERNILTMPAPFWIAVGILIHRCELTRLEATAELHLMADNNGRDVSEQAAALVAEVSGAA